MTGFEIGIISIIAMLLLIYIGMHVPVVLALISFVGVWIIKGNIKIAISLPWISAAKTVADFLFGVIPLFVLMGLLVSTAGMGRDTYDIAQNALRRVRGGLGMATVIANAIFAAITGVSIASATVFTRISVPEMLRYGYKGRFALLETMRMTEEVRRMVVDRANIADVKQQALDEGMLTLRRCALLNAGRGKTSLQEVEARTMAD